MYKTHACRCQHYEQRRRNPFFCCCNSKNGLFIEGRKRTNGMLLERLTFLINPLTRQIVALVLCVTSIDNELVHSFKTPLNIVTCEPLSTLCNVVTAHWTTPKNPDIGLLLRLNHVGRDKICTGRCPGDKDPQNAPQIGYKFKQPTPSALNCRRCNCEFCQIG